MATPSIADALQRLKTLIDSSTPIVVMETVEEMRAVRMVRSACGALNLATFEWSVASGLMRCGSTVGDVITGTDHGPHYAPPHADIDSIEQNAKALYNSREPAQMLANLEGITVEAAFILKDLHRHMDDPIVVRRLRDVGQRFATNRKDLSAAFVFYGGAPADITTITAPVYGFYAASDAARIGVTIPGTVDAMKAAGKKYDPITYDNSQHGFMRLGEDPSNTNTANVTAHDQSWQRMLTILKAM